MQNKKYELKIVNTLIVFLLDFLTLEVLTIVVFYSIILLYYELYDKKDDKYDKI